METDLYTLDERMVDVGDGHQLYAQLWGKADSARTFVFLHGGPGGSCSDSSKQLFDPTTDRVIFFDQRGSGKSLPYGSLEANNTDALVKDIDTIATAFNIDTFALVGGSWGSCLALIYAIRNPQKVQRLVLRGIFTGRKSEIDFMDKGKIAAFFPDVWERFLQTVPEGQQSNPRDYHMPRLFGSDTSAALQSAMAYSDLEGSIVALDDRTKPVDPEKFNPVPITIECHYLVNGCFIPEGYIIEYANKLTMPVAIVQGRYDIICPPFTAYDLHKAAPNSKLFWTVAGHSGHDRGNFDVMKAIIATKS
ncbi:MAG: alpha/beta fold hydrolase [Patescibacteria group bacterium]|nr:alpha/beta fold hydrolase [Patescibacteria group bacterium]